MNNDCHKNLSCYHLPQIGTFTTPPVRVFSAPPQYLLVLGPPLEHPFEAERLRMRSKEEKNEKNQENILKEVLFEKIRYLRVLIQNTYFQSLCSPWCNQCRPFQLDLRRGCQ